MIGIICAMDVEAKRVIDEYELTKLSHEKFDVYGSSDMVLVISKIGKIYAAAGTQFLLEHFDIDVIVNIGLAGGLNPGYHLGKVFLASSVEQHDVYLPWDGEHLDYLKKPINLIDQSAVLQFLQHEDDFEWGRVLTGDQFIDDAETCKKLAEKGDIVEMEAFAIASVCKVYKTPCIVIKTISDNADDDARDTFGENVDVSMLSSLPVLKRVVEVLKA